MTVRGRLLREYARRDRLISPRRYGYQDLSSLYALQRWERSVLAVLAREGLGDLRSIRILEIGCGTGHWLRSFIQWGARPDRLAGVDLLPERLATARSTCPRHVRLVRADASHLPFPSGHFMVVVQRTVFSSILNKRWRRAVARDMLRVLAPGGMILWYDLHVNNPRNQEVRAVTRAELCTLFPGCRISARRTTLAPPLARLLAPVSWLLCDTVALVPWLRTHTLAAIRPPS